MNKVRVLQRKAELAHNTSDIKLLQTSKLYANPVCGDNIAFKIIKKNDVIIEILHYTNSCSICNASISVLKELIQGKTIKEVHVIADAVKDFLTQPNISIDKRLVILSSIYKYPERYMCAYLPFRSLISEIYNEE